MNKPKIQTLYKSGVGIAVECGNVISFPIHMHTYYEMLLYEPFDGFVKINDYTIVPDRLTAIILVPSDFHQIAVNGASEAKYMKVGFDGDTIDKNVLPKTSMVLHSIASDSLFVKTYREVIGNPGNELYKKNLIQVILCNILQKGKSIAPYRNSSGNHLSAAALKIINEQFTENITLGSVAGHLCITPQHLSNTFKATMGINFSEYLSAVRLRYAEKLLLETDANITEICALCGYRNFSHFLRSFKKTYGRSPLKHRKLGRDKT